MSESMQALARTAASQLASMFEETDALNHIEIGTHRASAMLELRVSPRTSDRVRGTSKTLRLEYQDWAADLGRLPARKMVLWAGAFASLLSSDLPESKIGKRLLTYSWLHQPIASHRQALLKNLDDGDAARLGSIDHEVPTRDGVVYVGEGGLLVARRTPFSLRLFPYQELRSAKLGYDQALTLTLGHEVHAYEPVIRYQSDPDRQRDFGWQYLLSKIPILDFDSMYAGQHGIDDDTVKRQREKADPLAAVTHYIVHARDRQRAAQLGLQILKTDASDIEFFDAVFVPIAVSVSFDEALERFDAVRRDVLGLDSRYAGNILGNALGILAQSGKIEQAYALLKEAWIDEAVALGRLFFHNGACVAAMAGDQEMALRALEAAFAFGESLETIEGEDDLAALRESEGFERLRARVDSGDLVSSRKAPSFGPGDAPILIASFERRPKSDYLYRLVESGSPLAGDFFAGLVQNPGMRGDLLQLAFYCLIAVGDDASVDAARRLHQDVTERYGMLDFFMELGSLRKVTRNKEKFESDLRDIMGREILAI